MKLRNFVSASSLLLAGWLGFTFFHEVPTQRYPKLDKYAAAAPQPGESQVSAVTAKVSEPGVLQVSVSP